MASREDSLSLYSGYVNFKENSLDPYEMELNLFIGGERWLYCNEPNSPLPLDDSAQPFTTGRNFVPLLQPPPYPTSPTPTAIFAKDARSLPSAPFEPSIPMIPPCGGNNPLDCTTLRGVVDKQFQKSSTYSAEALQDSQFQSAPFIFSSFQEPDARLARKQNDHGQNQYHAQRDAGCLSHGEPSRPACNISFTRIYTSNTPPPTSPKTRRVGKACQNCRIKKRKCSKSRPCKACEIDGRKCEAPPEKSDRKRRKIARADGSRVIPA